MNDWIQYIPYHVDVDPQSPGRTQHWFNIEDMEKALGRKVTWVYGNWIEPGAVAGDHWHEKHEVVIWMIVGELEMTLARIDSPDEKVKVVISAEDKRLMVLPRHVYHHAKNASGEKALALMFATTQPREEGDEFYLG